MPHIVEWTSYGICSLLSSLWEKFRQNKVKKEPIPHYWIELTASLERALNYYHTGNAKVLTKGLMDPLWLSLSVIHDGLASISSLVVLTPLTMEPYEIRMVDWPKKKGELRVASQRSQIFNYGQDHFEVCPTLRRCAMSGFAGLSNDVYFRATWQAL